MARAKEADCWWRNGQNSKVDAGVQIAVPTHSRGVVQSGGRVEAQDWWGSLESSWSAAPLRGQSFQEEENTSLAKRATHG